jgi:predicted phage baseplate assembly protein
VKSARDWVSAEARSRIISYTPEWTNLRQGDAGLALVQLFGELAEPILERVNRLPEKSFVEFLRIAGVEPLTALSASAMLEFKVSDGAPQSVLVAKGFQVGARPASGEGDLVVFETERSLFAAPAKIEEMHVQEGALFLEVNTNGGEGAGFLPFGKKAIPGRALHIGLSGEAVPGPFITLGFRVAAPSQESPPVASGGVAPLAIPPAPLLRWDVLDGAEYQPADVIVDETGGLLRTGIIELRLPRQWRKGRPDGLQGDAPLRWLRLRIVFGQYVKSPSLSFIKLNMAQAIAARTIRNEALEHVTAITNVAQRIRNTRMRVSQTPVLAGSLILEVDEGGFDLGPALGEENEDGLQTEETGGAADLGATGKAKRWREVDDLSQYGPDDRVYVLDRASGEVTFGDGINGQSVPLGFRNVRAVSYRVGGGAGGAVQAEAVSTMLTSIPFITGVTNPLPASGGSDAESQKSTMRRGPQEIRARGRAVTVADYALMALRAQGARVERAHAISGLHPSFPGLPIPGVVGVFVVPPERNEGPPTPDEATLRAVSQYLSRELAPAGVEVVAAAPTFYRVRAEVSIIIDPAVDVGDAARRVTRCLDDFLHPLRGGDDGEGWPFGGTLQYLAIQRRLITTVQGIRAVPSLNLVVNGIRLANCTDFSIPAYSLFWPEGHEVVAIDPKEAL